ncbi:MAG TPA: SagB/ThcOx family dehydrogenase [Planctomycetota bacterium]|nr:SagB/ThcOx family dehydrogenase [Planctomycetota bacterium]
MSTIHELPTAVVYHEETKYSEQELRRNPRQLDWSSRPSPYKDVVSERRVDLTPWLPLKRNPFNGEELPDMPESVGPRPGLAEISRLLYFTYGVTAVMETPMGKTPLRAAPSAGALYPAEIYVATRDVDGLPDGVHDYQVRDHTLVTLWDGDFWSEFQRYAYGHEAIERSRVLVVFSGVFRRSSWRYEERAYRRVLLDVGHALGNLAAYATREGLEVHPISGFCDEAVNSLLFLDPAEEGVLMVCAVASEDALRGVHIRPSSVYPSRVVPTPARTPREGLLRRLHAASSIPPGETFAEGRLPDFDALEKPHADKPATPLPARELDFRTESIIVRRRSTRAFSGDPLSPAELGDILGYAYQPARAGSGEEGRGPARVFDPSLIETYVIVTAVDGVAPGVYYYAPGARELRLVKPGQFRDQTRHFCLGQELGGTAGAVVVHVSNLLDALAKYGERAYRYLHLDAGHLGQRMNLAAVAVGKGASGIGGFFDDEFNALLRLDRDRIVVYVTCLGVPD